MRIIGTFFWIIVGAILLWFFALNLGQKVPIQFFSTTFNDVDLIIVIFVTFFVGMIIGAIVLSTQVIKAKSESRTFRREKDKLLKELDGLRNLSIDEIPEPDTKIGPVRNR